VTFRRVLLAGLGVMTIPGGLACIESPPHCDGCPEPFLQKPQTSPENVVHNLQFVYVHRDIEQYAKLLAPEFRFVFQPIDAQEITQDSWTREEDLAGTRALFEAPVVTSITIDLVHGPAVDADDPELPPGAKEIRINQTFLQVDESTGITWVVSDIQDLFFRSGDATLDEDPDLWFLFDWRDIPSTGAPRTPASGEQETTWGKLKSRYIQTSLRLTPSLAAP
jgi:hypothetical protein